MKVYLAGGSSEAVSVLKWVDRCRDAGIEVTHDWASGVLAHQAKGGSDATLGTADRIRAALTDLGAVARADWFWLLMPERPSFGAGVEMGRALGKTPAIVSGPWATSIFTSLAEHVFDDHWSAWDFLLERHRAR